MQRYLSENIHCSSHGTAFSPITAVVDKVAVKFYLLILRKTRLCFFSEADDRGSERERRRDRQTDRQRQRDRERQETETDGQKAGRERTDRQRGRKIIIH